jgi:hypothetical protein
MLLPLDAAAAGHALERTEQPAASAHLVCVVIWMEPVIHDSSPLSEKTLSVG